MQRALGHYERAATRYAAYVALDDQSPLVLYKLGLSYYLDQRPKAAIAPLQRAIALNDSYAEAHYVLGLCLDAVQQPREAQASLERACVSRQPSCRPVRPSPGDMRRSGSGTRHRAARGPGGAASPLASNDGSRSRALTPTPVARIWP